MESKEHYVADKPAKNKNDDKFQRYGFAKRIADTILRRASEESIVFGLFGAWGEGKSSVLNFIDKELSNNENVIIVHFNPWRYGDEDQLLYNFFKLITQALGKELENKKEKVSKFISKYASGVKAFGFDIGIAAKNVAEVDLETFRERVTDFLDEAEIKLIVFIDDIDRLDKKEIYTLFRLVKLTADFSNTCYILSFDEDMVASAIGEKFGSGDKDAGKKFLEKIIQIPLTLPKAQPESLKKFCFNIVENALNSNQVEMDENDVGRFIFQFTSHLLPRLNTPRLAVRYGNALSFAIPLLYGNAHMSDLLLIEAVKIFYPEHYTFIKDHPQYFLGPYNDRVDGKDYKLIESVKQQLNEMSLNYNIPEQLGITKLLCDLFPALKSVYQNYVFGDDNYRQWMNEKRIVSSKYFERYFSYTVIAGDVSDIEFDELINRLTSSPIEQTITTIRQILTTASIDNLILKLRGRESSLSWQEGKQIALALCHISDLLPKSAGILNFGFETAQGQAAIFIGQILKNNEKKEDVFTFAKALMLEPQDFEFAYWINYWLRRGNTEDEKLFDLSQYNELANMLIVRAVKEAEEGSIFEKFPDQVHFLIPSWRMLDPEGLKKYINEFLDSNDENVFIFFRSLLPSRRVSGIKEEFKTDLDKEYYDFFKGLIDKGQLVSYIFKSFTSEELTAFPPEWNEYGFIKFSELNVARQFMHFYRQEIND